MILDRVIEGYLALRTQKEELAKKHKEEMEPLNTKMDKLENYLHAQLQAQVSRPSRRRALAPRSSRRVPMRQWPTGMRASTG
jgi:hypothetical protein